MKLQKHFLFSLVTIICFLLLTNCDSTPDPELLPSITTNSVTSIHQTDATTGGYVNTDGGYNVIARGVCWSLKSMPTIADNKTVNGAGIGGFVSSMTGLTAGTNYFVRAYATNSKGTGYGNEFQIYTLPLKLPEITTSIVADIAYTSAKCGGNITFDGGVSVITRGVCWSKKPNPTVLDAKTSDGAGVGTFTSLIAGLDPGTNYFIRAYATNSKGTGYGNEFEITTFPESPTVTDIDGNVYRTVTIGTQVWMAENLKVTKFNDGTNIPSDEKTAYNTTKPNYFWYQNDVNKKNIYGALYNWYAVNTDKLAPKGWHIPSADEWNVLINYLGGVSVAGAKLKEIGSIHWNIQNNATNESRFTALPGGMWLSSFTSMGNDGLWWCSSVDKYGYPIFYSLSAGSNSLYSSGNRPDNCFSARCVKD